MSSQVVNIKWKSKNFDKKSSQIRASQIRVSQIRAVKSEQAKSELLKFPQITVSSMELFFVGARVRLKYQIL